MRRILLALSLALAVGVSSLVAQQSAPATYQIPPKAIVDILDAPPLPGVVVSPTRDVLALLPRRSMPSIAELAQPMLGLAGIRVNPLTNGPHRAPLVPASRLRSIANGSERKVAVPADARIGFLGFSPDGRLFAFTNTTSARIDLFVGDVATAQIAQGRCGSEPAAWRMRLAGGQLGPAVPFVPAGRGPAPVLPPAPSGPNVQENYGPPGPLATYQDMLTSSHDENLFEHYFTAELGIVDATSLRRTAIGRPGMISATPSPNGEHLLISRIKRPFSRLLPSGGFPQDVEIWNRRGERVRTVADVPMRDTVPINGVITGPRSVRWLPHAPATLLWVEALDKGDLRNAVPHRDRMVTLAAPFAGDPGEVAKTEYRYGGVSWTEKGSILLTENDRASRTTRTWVLNANWSEPRKLWDRRQQDSYGNPGNPLMRPGRGTVLQTGDSIYLAGAGASSEGDRRSSIASISGRSRPSACSAAARPATKPSSGCWTTARPAC